MKQHILDKISKDVNIPISFKLYKGQQAMFIGNLAIACKTCDENGNTVYVTDITEFPKKINKKYVQDSLDANLEDLGEYNYFNWQHFNDETFTIVDLETTGFSLDKGGRIIEIGAVKINTSGDILDTFSELINPGMRISPRITEVTTITNEMVKDKPPIDAVITKLYDFLRGTTVVAHNAKFDWDRYLLPTFKNFGINIPSAYPCIDTLVVDKILHAGDTKHNLSFLCERYGISDENHHRAIADVIMTAKVFINLRNECEEFWKNKPKTKWVDIRKNKDACVYEIKGCKTWEVKDTSGKIKQQRKYVDFELNGIAGTAFYDNVRKYWGVKSYAGMMPVDFLILEKQVLKFLGRENIF